MASWTDRIPTFNPYVEQQPIDTMLKVGVYKQQKYEEGVKRIQTNIDNVAGLDIANPVQQKYLQSKLNSLGNNLTFLAAGDFSDFSLVNSVNGMTKQITKDEDVLNAVSSTARLRAGYKKREELAKKGLTDKNNDDYYDSFASEYVNSKDVKAKFNADYIPHTNIVKKLQQALVGAGESSTLAEQIFVTGADGKPLVINGKYQYADAKTINKLVTNKPAVLAAINNVMAEGDVQQQLGIDGWATYRNTEATTLLEPLKVQYDNERERLQQQSLEVTAMLSSTNLSPEQKEAYLNAATQIESSLLSNDSTFMSLSAQAKNDPESFKQNYYTQEFKQRLMNQFIKTEEETTYGTNEALQQQNWRDTMAFNQAQERNKIAYQNEQLKIARSGDQREWMKFNADYELDPVTGNYNKKPEPGKAKTTFDANKPLFSGGTPGSKVNARNIVEEDISSLTAEKNKMAFSLYADFIRTNKDDPSISDADILKQVKVYAKKLGVSSDAFLDRWASNIKNKYNENGLTPPPNINDDLDAYINTATSLNNKMNQVESARKSANAEADVDNVISNETKKRANINITTNEGERITLTPQELLEIVSREIRTVQPASPLRGKGLNPNPTAGTVSVSVSGEGLNSNQKKYIDLFYKNPGKINRATYAFLNEVRNSYKPSVAKVADALEKSDKIFNDKLAKIVGVSDTVTGLLPMDSDSKPTTIGMLATYVNSGERNYGTNSDRQAALDALDNATAVSWKGKKPTTSGEDWVGEIIITGPKGTTPVTITNVNRGDLQTFTNAKFTDYKEKPIQDALNMNDKTKSTNSVYMPGSPNAWKTSFYKGTQINPAVTQAGWNYRADVIKSGGGYRLVNYIKPPGAKSYITVYGAAIATDENIIDNTYKTTSPAELNAMYLNYLHNQKQK